MRHRVADTLRCLLLEPGRLTADRLSGRRERWVAATALFVACSAAFFAAAGIARNAARPSAGYAARTAADSAVMAMVDSATFVDTPAVADNLVVRMIGAGNVWTLITHQAAIPDAVADGVAGAAFLMVPFFAAATFAAWRTGTPGYGAHLLFALDVHAAGFAALVLPVLLQGFRSTLVDALATVAVLTYSTWYIVVGGRRVFGGTARQVNMRLAIAGALYAPVFAATALVLALAALRSR